MLAHRLRRWPNIVPTLDERLLFADICTVYIPIIYAIVSHTCPGADLNGIILSIQIVIDCSIKQCFLVY